MRTVWVSFDVIGLDCLEAAAASGAEIVGNPVSLLVPQDRIGELRDIVAQISVGQPVKGLETTRVRKNGSLISVALSASPVRGADGAVTGASVIYRDLSD